MVRPFLANTALSSARLFVYTIGCEIAVDDAGATIEYECVVPHKATGRAWDPNLRYRDNIFPEGSANPVRLTKTPEDDPQDPEAAAMWEVGLEATEDGAIRETDKARVIPSWRYQSNLDQHALSEMSNPDQRYKYVLYGLMAVGGLLFLNLALTASGM